MRSMSHDFVVRYAVAIGLMAGLLVCIYGVARFMARAKQGVLGKPGLARIMASIPLPGAPAIHVVRMGERYVVIATSNASVALIGELPETEITVRQAPKG